MKIILFGISHRTSILDIREKYVLLKKRIVELYFKVKKEFLVNEFIIISTCNRLEFYCVTKNTEKIIRFLSDELILDREDMKFFYFMEGVDVVKHLFRLTSGLESQVIGETQIFNQVKEAYFLAKDLGLTSKYFNKLFQSSFHVSKIVRTLTSISRGNISIPKISLIMAGNLDAKNILFIGTGRVIEIFIRLLRDVKANVTIISNKSYDKAINLAKMINGRAGKFDILNEEIKNADIIVSATSSPHFVLKRENFVLRKDYDKELIIFDLACPRDVEPEVKNFKFVKLYDLDDINSKVDENYNYRLREYSKAAEIIEKEVLSFLCKRLELEVVPVI